MAVGNGYEASGVPFPGEKVSFAHETVQHLPTNCGQVVDAVEEDCLPSHLWFMMREVEATTRMSERGVFHPGGSRPRRMSKS